MKRSTLSLMASSVKICGHVWLEPDKGYTDFKQVIGKLA